MSTAILAAKNEGGAAFVHEAAFDPGALPSGVLCEPLFHKGQALDSFLVTFEQGMAVFDIGVPFLKDGTFFSYAFTHLKYPERYVHFFSNEARVC